MGEQSLSQARVECSTSNEKKYMVTKEVCKRGVVKVGEWF